ncbi:Caleosin related protein-domain-containing protein [Aspergillus egyptiacus]|nr:Caleosin related protein-domain-containing protein [Aspergillus egyptiacus]
MVKADTEVQSQASQSTGISPRQAQAMEISKPNMRRNVVVMREESADQEDESNADIQVIAKKCPITIKRIPAVSAASHITNPGAARCTVIEGDDSDGSMKRFKDYTPMQQHILFWDRDADGKIYPYDTYVGFRQLGFNILFSFLAVLIINLNFSYPTRLAHSYLPDPRFRVYVDSIYKAKHGSDSGTYDAEGRFIPQAFEDMFGKYDGDNDGTLTLRELFEMMHGNRCAADPFGWGAAFFEWGTTWLLIQKDGKVYKEDLQGVYDGSIFWKIEEARKTPEGWTQGYGLGGDGFVGGVKVF